MDCIEKLLFQADVHTVTISANSNWFPADAREPPLVAHAAAASAKFKGEDSSTPGTPWVRIHFSIGAK
jgi:hypothetical protein